MGKGIILAIDFSMDFTQLAYLENDVTPKNIHTKNKDTFQIPTTVCYNKELMEWSSGDEAVSKGRLNNSTSYTNLPKMCNKKMRKDDREVIKVFMEYLLDLARRRCKTRVIRDILISVEDLNPTIVDNIKKIFVEMGFEKKQVRIVSHTESFIYFILNQNSDIWVNKVLLVNYNKYDFSFRKLSVMKSRKPYVADVEEKDYSFIENKIKEKNVVFDSELDDNAMVQLDKSLARQLAKELKDDVVSAIYLVGQGFIDANWDNTIKEICENRRVFQGNNLFVKGAAYAAKEIFHLPTLEEFVISCEGRTRVKITMSLKKKDRDSAIALSDIGQHWYGANKTIECITEEPTVAEFAIHDIINKKTDHFELDLTGFPKRPPKTTRLQVNFKYLTEHEIEVEIKDLGFGEFYEASNKSVKKTLKV